MIVAVLFALSLGVLLVFALGFVTALLRPKGKARIEAKAIGVKQTQLKDEKQRRVNFKVLVQKKVEK